MPGQVYIGISGWYYQHWRGPFYPPKLPSRAWLPFYAERLCCVEVNNTFYRLPAATTFTHWHRQTPEHFFFAVKVWRLITHWKRLVDCADAVQTFLTRVDLLGEKVGALLFQFPPDFQCHLQRLSDFLSLLPKHRRYTFELRHPSWHHQAIYDLLSDHNAAFCVFELDGFLSPLMSTADFVYIRLHGPGAPYCGQYDVHTLQTWVEQLRHWRDQNQDVYLFFDNDEAGFAVQNALQLQQLMEAIR